MEDQIAIEIINQLFEIGKKAEVQGFQRIDQNLKKSNWLLEQAGFIIKDPTGEVYDHTRTDCEATILTDKEPLVITETLKPAIFKRNEDGNSIVQLARVVIK